MKRPWLLLIDNADDLNDPTCPAGVEKICKRMWQRMHLPRKKLKVAYLQPRQMQQRVERFGRFQMMIIWSYSVSVKISYATFRCRRKRSWPRSYLFGERTGSPTTSTSPRQAAAYIFHLILKITLTDIKQLSFVWLLKQQHATALSLDAQHRFTQPGWWTLNMSKKGHLPLQRLCAFQLFSSLNVFLSMSSILDLLNSIRRNWEKVSFSYSDTGDILKILSNYSLFTVDHQCKLFRVHKLVQEVVGESLTESERIKTFVECVRALRFAFLQFFCIREF